jgi:hypothetical protein
MPSVFVDTEYVKALSWDKAYAPGLSRAISSLLEYNEQCQ